MQRQKRAQPPRCASSRSLVARRPSKHESLLRRRASTPVSRDEAEKRAACLFDFCCFCSKRGALISGRGRDKRRVSRMAMKSAQRPSQRHDDSKTSTTHLFSGHQASMSTKTTCFSSIQAYNRLQSRSWTARIVTANSKPPHTHQQPRIAFCRAVASTATAWRQIVKRLAARPSPRRRASPPLVVAARCRRRRVSVEHSRSA